MPTPYTHNMRNKSFFDNFQTPSSATPRHFTSLFHFAESAFFPTLSFLLGYFFVHFSLHKLLSSFRIPQVFRVSFLGFQPLSLFPYTRIRKKNTECCGKIKSSCRLPLCLYFCHPSPGLRICYAVSPSDANHKGFFSQVVSFSSRAPYPFFGG